MSSARQDLLQLLAAKSFRLGEFKLSSGGTSDYYIDCRTTTLDAKGSRLTGQVFWDEIRARGWKAQAIGGLTMGADPIVVSVAVVSGEVHGFLLQPGTTANALVAGVDGAQVPRYSGRVGPLELKHRSANPARTGAELEYSLPRGGFVTLRVMDVSGRTVRTLVTGDIPAGTRVVPWNLSDDTGKRVDSGIYFARLSLGRESRTVRMSVVR